MMNEIVKIIDEHYSDNVTSNGAGSFNLLDSNSDFEVFLSDINQERNVLILPSETAESTTVVHVIEGSLYYTNEERVIKPETTLVFKNLESTHLLRVIENCKIILIRKKRFFDSQTNMIDSLYTIMSTIQEKDSYTEAHCNRCGNLAVEIGVRMKLDEKAIVSLMLAGKIHDLGKIEIDTKLLNKEDLLTTEEFLEIKKHSKFGYDLACSKGLDQKICNSILEHHEKLDGTGYPLGLKDVDLSIESRILAVADCFDAMTSDRPYRKALSVEDALSIIRSESGTKYDETVVTYLEQVIGSRE
jgi:HD-GYP domain-containing protein (c-di-GMP phosphodiesterase class II)